MFVLYYFHQDYDGGECEILATSSSKEKLEKKRDELMAPSLAYNQAFKEYEETAKKEIREFCERQRQALKADRSVIHHLHNSEQIDRFKKYNEVNENRCIERAVGNYYCFSGLKPHLDSLYLYHFDKDKLTEDLPVFVQPIYPARGFHESCMFIEDIEEVE